MCVYFLFSLFVLADVCFLFYFPLLSPNLVIRFNFSRNWNTIDDRIWKWILLELSRNCIKFLCILLLISIFDHQFRHRYTFNNCIKDLTQSTWTTELDIGSPLNRTVFKFRLFWDKMSRSSSICIYIWKEIIKWLNYTIHYSPVSGFNWYY